MDINNIITRKLICVESKQTYIGRPLRKLFVIPGSIKAANNVKIVNQLLT